MLIALELVAVTSIYVAAIRGFVVVLRWLKLPGAVFFGFLAFGALSGLLAATLWPVDSSVFANVFAVLGGDRVYSAAIQYLGDSHSANAHETIPWVLRVPQVYMLVSVVLSGMAGLALEWWLSGRRSKA